MASLNRLLIDAAEKVFEEKHEEAEAILLDALMDFPESYLVFYNLGVIYMETGRPEQALVMLDRALKLNSSDCDVLIETALACQKTGSLREAQEYYDTASRLAETSHKRAVIYNNSGSINFAAGEYDKAAALFNKSLSEESSYEEARQNLLLVNTYLGFIGKL
jgi:Tfp pilus assembly protein PilF